MIEIESLEDLERVTTSAFCHGKHVVILFYEDRCTPLKLVQDKLFEWSMKTNGLIWILVNARTSTDIARAFQVEVVPTFSFVAKGVLSFYQVEGSRLDVVKDVV
jgi:hypothetical protein